MSERPLGDQFPFVNGRTLGIDNKETKKAWGSYTDYYRTDTVVFKTIQVNPNQRLSLQSHEKRSEIWFVKEGKCTCVLDDNTVVLENHTDDICIVAEMQFGLCSEDDIIRYEDDYGRA